jgi:RNA polymerase sigma-70 factor (ECF subfamily)
MNENADDRSGDLLARWRQGDQQAAEELFRRYADRLIALARSRLPAKLASRTDPEDVVQSVYRSFFTAAREGRYDVPHGGDLWRLLVRITFHKLYRQLEHNTAGKRAVEREQPGGDGLGPGGIPGHLLARDPSPVEAVALADELEHFMRGLEPLERRLMELRLQGYNVEEIAADTQLALRTVYRILERVKHQLANWQLANREK